MNPRRSILLSGTILAVVLAGVLIYASSQGGRAATDTVAAPVQGAALGNPAAPVLIEEFADFQCPFCGRFSRETKPQIVETYVQPGKARFVFKHLAFIGPESLWAAQAAECAADQGAFWPYHDKLFASQAGENRGAFAKDRLKAFARELQLDAARFDRCLDGDETLARVRADVEEAQKRGIRSTPAFYINGKAAVQGAQPFEQFKAAIDPLVAGGR